MVILDIGTNEKEDTCYYPDEDMYLQKSNGHRRVFRGTDSDSSWTSEPKHQVAASADSMGLSDDNELDLELADFKGMVSELGYKEPGKTV